MKRPSAIISLLAGLLAVLSPPAFGQAQVVGLNCKVAWTMPATPDLAGFRLYQSTTSKGYVKGKFADELPAKPITATTTFTGTCDDFDIVKSGSYFIAVSAYDTLGNESPFSGELALTVDASPPAAPGTPQIGSITVTVQ
jgi:hypothetical protein